MILFSEFDEIWIGEEKQSKVPPDSCSLIWFLLFFITLQRILGTLRFFFEPVQEDLDDRVVVLVVNECHRHECRVARVVLGELIRQQRYVKPHKVDHQKEECLEEPHKAGEDSHKCVSEDGEEVDTNKPPKNL